MDQQGNTLDFLLSAKRDQAAAVQFLRKAIVAWRRQAKLTLDKYQPNHLAVRELKGTGYLKRPTIRTTKCITNCIEQDHHHIKQRVPAMQTFQVFRHAQVTIAGIELAHRFLKEKRKRKAHSLGTRTFENPWMKLLAA